MKLRKGIAIHCSLKTCSCLHHICYFFCTTCFPETDILKIPWTLRQCLAVTTVRHSVGFWLESDISFMPTRGSSRVSPTCIACRYLQTSPTFSSLNTMCNFECAHMFCIAFHPGNADRLSGLWQVLTFKNDAYLATSCHAFPQS